MPPDLCRRRRRLANQIEDREVSLTQAPLPLTAVRPASDALAGRRFLIVEDEPLVSLVLADGLEEAGATIIGTAASVDEALRFIEMATVDAAILDCNLRGRPVDEVAAALIARGVPFLFVSGYGRAGLPAGFGDIPILAKPFTQAHLLRAARELLASQALPAGQKGKGCQVEPADGGGPGVTATAGLPLSIG